MNKAFKLIVITGGDGSGKSTLLNLLRADHAFSQRAHFSEIWSPMARLPQMTKENLQGYLQTLSPRSRTLFLFHALMESMDGAMRSGRELIVADGYWYKYAVTELTLSGDWQIVQSLASLFPRPDLTIFLESDAGLMMARKQAVGLSLYEKQLSKSMAQSENLWQELEREHGPWTHFSAMSSPQDRLRDLRRLLDSLSPGGSHASV